MAARSATSRAAGKPRLVIPVHRNLLLVDLRIQGPLSIERAS